MLLFIEFYLLARYRYIGIFGESEGVHSCGTNLDFLRIEAINRITDRSEYFFHMKTLLKISKNSFVSIMILTRFLKQSGSFIQATSALFPI